MSRALFTKHRRNARSSVASPQLTTIPTSPSSPPAPTSSTPPLFSARRANDFWLPEVSQDGQIFYVNIHTGKHSRDLPREIYSSLHDEAFPLSPSTPPRSSRISPLLHASLPFRHRMSVIEEGSASSSRRAYGSSDPILPEHRVVRSDSLGRNSSAPTKIGEPSPNNSVTHPQNDRQTHVHIRDTSDSHLPPSRVRLPPSSNPTRSRSLSTSSVARPTPTLLPQDNSVRNQNRKRAGTAACVMRPAGAFRMQLATPTEQPEPDEESENNLLPKNLAGSPLDSPTELIRSAHGALSAFKDYLKSVDPILLGRPERKKLDDSVTKVIAGIRNLVYITATPIDRLPDARGKKRDSLPPSPTHGLRAYLNPHYFKIIKALSALLQLNIVIQNSPSISIGDSKMEVATTELEQAVDTFVQKFQKYQDQHRSSPTSGEAKRLFGAFATASVDLTALDATTAGWRGPLASRSDEQPKRRLQKEVITELKGTVGTIEHKLLGLVTGSSNAFHKADRLHADTQFVVARLTSLLKTVADLDVTQHTDIAGTKVDPKTLDDPGQYTRSVEKARLVASTLRDAVEDLYSDASTLFTTAQRIQTDDQVSSIYISQQDNQIKSPATSIMTNLSIVLSSLEGLWNVGNEQAHFVAAAAAGHGHGHDDSESTPVVEPVRSSRDSCISIVDGNIYAGPSGEEFNVEETLIKPLVRVASSSPDESSWPNFASPLSSSTTSEDNLSRASQDGFVEPGVQVPVLVQVSAPVSGTVMGSGTGMGTGIVPATPPRSYRRISGAETLVGSTIGSFLSSNASTLPPEDESLYPTHLNHVDTSHLNDRSPQRGDKLKKIFGSEAPRHYIDSLNAEAMPWYLRPNYDPEEIFFEPNGDVKAGTASALVQRLTAHEYGDPTFIKYFLMTFKSFMTLDELFELLVLRFWIKPPDGLTKAEMAQWERQKQHVVRARVLNVVKAMITDEDILEKSEMYILDRMQEFVSNEEVITFPAAKHVLALIQRAKRDGKPPVKTMNLPPPPTSMIPRVGKPTLLDIEPQELARQLTIMENDLYRKIRPLECLRRTRQSSAKNDDSISAVIQLSNKIGYWVAEAVLSRADSRKRSAVIKHFIATADRCRCINNFATMTAIISGLNLTPVRRLKRSWELVAPKYISQFEVCEAIMNPDKNFSNYWTTLSQCVPPCIPFIGRYLSTLTFINDGADDRYTQDLINFRKRQKAAEIIQSIKRWQVQLYSLHPVPSILVFIEESLAKFGTGMDYSDQFYKLSLEREPKEREDERVIRDLYKQGFL